MNLRFYCTIQAFQAKDATERPWRKQLQPKKPHFVGATGLVNASAALSSLTVKPPVKVPSENGGHRVQLILLGISMNLLSMDSLD
jgi:hypothetical protein